LTIQSSARARSAFADVRGEFVAEFDGLKRAAAMERLAAITSAALSRNMIAHFLSELRNCANVR
jgi:hypothetical protein